MLGRVGQLPGDARRLGLGNAVGVRRALVGKERDEIRQDRRLDEQRLKLGEQVLQNHAHAAMHDVAAQEVACSSKPGDLSSHLLLILRESVGSGKAPSRARSSILLAISAYRDGRRDKADKQSNAAFAAAIRAIDTRRLATTAGVHQ